MAAARKHWDPTADDVVPEGTYSVAVVDARALPGKAFLWLDLQIVGGRDDGRVVSVGLHIPDDSSSRGAIHFFRRKIRGFVDEIRAARVFELPDDEQPRAIAEAIIGCEVTADLSVRSGGKFDGTQQLDATR